MTLFNVLAYVEPVAGLMIAIVATLIATRRRGAETGRRRIVAAAATLLAIAILILWRRWMFWPWFSPSVFGWDGPFPVQLVAYLLPLTLAVALVVVLAWPTTGGGRGRATLEPRGLSTVVRPWWVVGGALVIVAWLGLALAAGFASRPDPRDGHYTYYEVRPAREYAGGTTIYGWYFSIPSAIAVGILLALTVVALILIARSRLRGIPEDRVTRLHRSRNVVAVTAGALAFLLGGVLRSLSGTASTTMSFATDTAGPVTVVSPFAALGPALGVSSQIVVALGFALWWFVALAALRARRLPVAE